LEHEETYDAVLLGDAAALAFALEHQHDLFPETPMVFFGLNDPETVRLAAQNPFVTGSVNQSDFSQTIELATKLNKTATNITAVYDDSTEHGRSEGQRFFALKNRYPEFTFSALKTSDYTRTELGKQLAQFTDDTILICLSAYFDKEGFYHSIPETAHFFYTHAKIPVYTKLFGSVGKGFLGGYLFDFIEAGRYSAQVILDVLDGKSMSDYPLKKDLPSHFYFDDEQLKHFRLNAHLLPKGTILVNEKPSFWHQFHVVLIPFITIVASLTLLLILIFHYARQLRRVHDIDALTKLPNRHVVQAAVRNLLKAKCDFAIIMIDVDELKLMNAFYTFACGDYILCEMARRLKSIDRLSDYMIARYANDDFAIVLKDTRLRKNDSLLYLIKQIISEPFEFSE
ncbi:MAG: diguanylate cyclase, partial [Treponemataceae bacterium]|nr:diguanylate cyclase [Treponemataceae bacterium]